MLQRAFAPTAFVFALGLFGACSSTRTPEGDVTAGRGALTLAHATEATTKRSIVLDGAKGWLCIVGGGGTTDDMYERMLGAAGGKDAKVVILPQASELADTGAGSAEAWTKHGATNVEWLDLKDPARDAEKVRAARVIWFPGGVQTRLMKALHEAGLVELVRQRFKDGAVVGGTSAGAAVMSDVMITGDYDLSFKPAPAAVAESTGASGTKGPSGPGSKSGGTAAAGSAGPSGPGDAAGTPPRAGAGAARSGEAGAGAASAPPGGVAAESRTAASGAAQPGGAQGRAPGAPGAANAPEEDSGLQYIRNGTNAFSTGLGLMQGAIVDQHFVRRQRFNRLLSAVLDHPDLVGIGIDEKTSILVHGNRFEVVGVSNVLVIDARGSGDASKDRFVPGSITGAKVSVLRAGQTYDLAR